MKRYNAGLFHHFDLLALEAPSADALVILLFMGAPSPALVAGQPPALGSHTKLPTMQGPGKSTPRRAPGRGPGGRRLAMAPALLTTRAQKGHFCSSAD